MQRRHRPAAPAESGHARARDLAGAGSAEITALGVAETGDTIPLPPGRRILLGSGLGCDIVLEDPEISSAHCVLEQRPGHTVVRDDGSVYGTFLNGARVHEPVELRPGALLRLGTRSFVALAQRRYGPGSAFSRLIGQDPAFRKAVATAMRAAVTDCSVLVLGETGTGKELMAQAIHEASPRAGGPLVALNCGAIPSQLIGSELFGHAQGAFTGAGAERDGMFVHARGGTLFLDELGELPMEQQPHLLRVLETRHVRRLGANSEQPVDVRLIAATNRMDATGSSRLRLDLYHRLATVVIELPPLRARQGDVPLLVRAFMDELSRDFGHRQIRSRTLQALSDHAWPGNVRELRAAIQRAMALCPRELTLEQLLPRALRSSAAPDIPRNTNQDMHRNRDRDTGDEPDAIAWETPLPGPDPISGASHAAEPGPAPLTPPAPARHDGVTPLDVVLRERMRHALVRCGSIRRAAQALGMPKSTFADRARRLGVFRDVIRNRYR
ncbi:MAG TPA: sigma 54-interacting transcriptional regulator [Haliangium sp.]|nr:sigma 54-interacting transcriptional regulator [Haliangium sp.]